MEYLTSGCCGDKKAYAFVGGAVGTYRYAGWQILHNVATTHALYGESGRDVLCQNVVGEYVYALMILRHVEYGRIVMVGMTVGDEEYNQSVGVTRENMSQCVSRVAIIVEYENRVGQSDDESAVLKICYMHIEVFYDKTYRRI